MINNQHTTDIQSAVGSQQLAVEGKARNLQPVLFDDLGLINFNECWDYQESLFKEIIDIKLNNRNQPKDEQTPTKNYLLFCEHPHVYTLGKSGSIHNLLINDTQREKKGVSFYKINRGGDITYHGPGQIVGYPIFDLDCFFTDISRYLRYLEKAIIKTLAEYDIEAGIIEGETGVWLSPNNSAKARKIAAIGVKCSRWVTMHGFAFNVNTDLAFFNYIIPCGITDKSVTSMQKEMGEKINIIEVKEKLKRHFAELFEIELI